MHRIPFGEHGNFFMGGKMNRTQSFVLMLLLPVTILLAACGSAATPEASSTAVPAPTETRAALTLPPPANTPALAPVNTATAAPVTTSTPAQTATRDATPGAAVLRIPPVNCCRGQALKPGTYAFPAWHPHALTVRVGEGWKVLNEKAALLFLLGRGENVQQNPSQLIVLLDVTDKTTLQGLADALQHAPQLTPLGEPVHVTVAGFSGVQLDLDTKPNPSYQGDRAQDIPPGVQFLPVIQQYFTPGFLWTTSTPEAHIRAIMLTVQDKTLLVYLEAPPDEFEQFAADADTLLQSLALNEK